MSSVPPGPMPMKGAEVPVAEDQMTWPLAAARDEDGGMRFLVVFGPKRGGTAGLADMIGDVLIAAGCEAEVSPANGVYDPTGIDAVIVVGALYVNRWHRDARRFVRRNTTALKGLPVWLVSSGPLDDSAERRDIPPTKQVAKLADRISARGHVTFGGRLTPNARGFVASAMAKTNAGDWRNEEHLRRWVDSLVAELNSSPGRAPQIGHP